MAKAILPRFSLIPTAYRTALIIQGIVMQKLAASKQPSDWDEDLIDLTQVDENASKQEKIHCP